MQWRAAPGPSPNLFNHAVYGGVKDFSERPLQMSVLLTDQRRVHVDGIDVRVVVHVDVIAAAEGS
jgi:hypothetical protein